ncbi:MAG: GGDEF domain-containing protein [Bacillota bacterium]
MLFIKNDDSISITAEFKDKELEKEFFNNEIKGLLKYIKPMLLALGVLYFLFIIPDYYLISDSLTIIKILINRIAILILIVILYLKIDSFKNYEKLASVITIYEVIVSMSFIYIFYQYESPDFLIQAYGVMLIILGIFLMPNKWVFKNIAAVFVAVGFILVSLVYIKDIKMAHFSAGIVYTILAIILNSITSFRLEINKRKQFFYSKRLEELSTKDSLTQLYNRLKFDQELAKWIANSRRYNFELSLIMLDIDDFKNINDNYGHLVGDSVLVEAAQLLSHQVRETDVLARWGGEEFIILLPYLGLEKALATAQRLQKAIANTSFGTVGTVAFSMGVTALYDEDDSQTFINRADKLLYKGKKAGKNTINCS